MVRDTNELLEEIRSLVGENNDMLRAQRRNAFIGGIVKWIIRFAFILIPLYYYLTYVHPTLTNALNQMNALQQKAGQVQSTTQEYTSQVGGFFDSVKGVWTNVSGNEATNQ